MSAAANYHSIADWIAREARVCALGADAQWHEAVDWLVTSLGTEVELLGLGEALHGGEEILIFRNRLLQRLVEAHGFTAIAIESSFPRGRFANEYVTGEVTPNGKPKFADFESAAAAGVSHGFGKLAANRELLEWMRAHNADRPAGSKVHFYGFDQPAVEAAPASPGELLRFVLEYLAQHDGVRAQTFRARVEPWLGEDPKWGNPMAWRDPATSAELLAAATELRIATEDLISELRTRRPELVASGDRTDYLAAIHYAATCRQYLKFFVELAQGTDWAASLGVRDRIMADNLSFILERERGRGKVLAFAHNMHLQRGQAHWQIGPMQCRWWPAGAQLAATMGRRFAVIGTAVGTSEENGIGIPEAGTLEASLSTVDGAVRMLPTHFGKNLPDDAMARLPARSASTKNPTYFPLSTESLANFDWLATFAAVTYNRGGRPLA